MPSPETTHTGTLRILSSGFAPSIYGISGYTASDGPVFEGLEFTPYSHLSGENRMMYEGHLKTRLIKIGIEKFKGLIDGRE